MGGHSDHLDGEAEPFVLLDDSHHDPASAQNQTQVKALSRMAIAAAKDRMTIVAAQAHDGIVSCDQSSTAEVGGEGSAAITIALREAAKRISSPIRSVNLVLPASICEYQVVSLPPMDARARERYLAELASKMVKQEESCYATLTLSTTAIATEVLLTAAAKVEVETIVKACHRAGIVPERALPPFVPALALFACHLQDKKDPIVLVDLLSREELNLIVWDDGKIRVHRNIRKEAGSDRWEEFLDSEVYRTVAYYRTQSGGRRVNRLYMIAPVEESYAIKQRFEAVGMFEAGVHLLEIQGLPAGFDSLVPLGAATACLPDSSAPKLDLMPSELRNPKRRQVLTFASIALATLGLAGEFLALKSVHQANEKRTEVLRAASSFSSALSSYQKDYERAESRRDDFKTKVDEFERLLKQRVPFPSALSKVLSTESSQVYLKGLSVQANGRGGAFEVILYGSVDNTYKKDQMLEIDRYIGTLRKIPGVRSVDRLVKKINAPVQGTMQREEFEIHVVFPAEVQQKP